MMKKVAGFHGLPRLASLRAMRASLRKGIGIIFAQKEGRNIIGRNLSYRGIDGRLGRRIVWAAA